MNRIDANKYSKKSGQTPMTGEMNFICNVSPEWLEAQFQLWQQSPESVSSEWRSFFRGFELGNEAESPEAVADSEAVRRQCGIISLIHRYRTLGHLLACTDPLSSGRRDHPMLQLEQVGLREADLESAFTLRDFTQCEGTLSQVLEILHNTYSRHIGVEFMHIQEPEERTWLVDRMEPCGNSTPEPYVLKGRC